MGYRVISSRRLLWRGLVFLAIAASLIAVYALLLYLMSLLLPKAVNQAFIAAIVLIILVALIVTPLKMKNKFFRGFLDRPASPVVNEPALPVLKLDTVLTKLASASNLDNMAVELLSLLRQQMQSNFSAFTLYSEVEKLVRFDYVKFEGDNQHEPDFRRLVFRPIEQFNKPQLAYADNESPQRGIIMKLEVSDKLKGLLCIGPRHDNEPFLQPELDMLERLAEPLAATVRKTLHTRDLEDKIELQEDKIGSLEENCNQLKRSRDELQMVNQRVVQIVEEERNRIALELQTELLQTINQIINQFEGQINTLTEREEIVWHLSHSSSKAIHNIIGRLRPASLDQLGLAAALMGMRDEIQQQVKLAFRLKIAPELEQRRLPTEIELGLYRVAQEALQNVMKHSKAHHVTISLSLMEESNTVRLAVVDDGVGFEPPGELDNKENGFLGLAGMQERLTSLGGRFKLRSSPGAGTILEAEVPLEPVEAKKVPVPVAQG